MTDYAKLNTTAEEVPMSPEQLKRLASLEYWLPEGVEPTEEQKADPLFRGWVGGMTTSQEQ